MTTVLVVDDSSITLAMVRALLRRHGYDTVETQSAPGALALITGAKPGVVIADLKMPGMNGYELAQAIRSDPALADLPIVFYTAYYEAAQDCARTVEVADTRIVPKSGEPHLLIDAVADALGA